MDKFKIEKAALDLQKRIWQQQKILWPHRLPQPIDMLDPVIAAKVLNINFEYHEELGAFGDRSGRFEIAGLLDRQVNKIAISKRFSLEIVRFTGAHEIGHWVLHPGEVMHRDLPIEGLGNKVSNRRPEEREADYFAACFLMPRKLVTKTFQSTFRVKPPFVFDDTSAFNLCPDDPDSLLRPYDGSLDRALGLASAKSYGGEHFDSLAKQFRVSVKTMAIRLKELGLIQE